MVAFDGLRAGRCIAHVVVRFAKDCAMDACQFYSFDGCLQVLLRGNAKHYEIACLLWRLKSVPSFQASVAYLDDLIRERNVRANQNVDIVRIRLHLRHGRVPCLTWQPALLLVRYTRQREKPRQQIAGNGMYMGWALVAGSG